ncbi:MAG: carbon-nitrogen hydrolase family protein [Parachlamydiales bacterium]|jgi:nitrilase
MNLVAAIQMNSGDSVKVNLARVAQLVQDSAKKGAQLIVLPENAAFFGKNEKDKFLVSEKYQNGPIQDFMSKLAKNHNVWLIGGTIPIIDEENGKTFSSSIVWNEKGEIVSRYDKMHLFDVFVDENEQYQESEAITSGKKIICIESPFGKLGLSICYDLRFPELFRAQVQNGVNIISISSAFTNTTGKIHWECLIKARAIENQCYVIASNQTGIHPTGFQSFGHSMIVDPWGKVLASLEEEEGVVLAEIDLEYLKILRKRFPVLEHQKIFNIK